MTEKEKIKELNTEKFRANDQNINRLNYPMEFCVLYEERWFVCNFSRDASELLYNDINKIKDFIINLSSAQIDSILNIKIKVQSLPEQGNMLEIIIKQLNNVGIPSISKEGLIVAIDHMVKTSAKAREIFIKNYDKFNNFLKSGHRIMIGKLEVMYEMCVNNYIPEKKLEGKLPFKGLKGVREIKRINGKYCRINLGTGTNTRSIQLTSAGLGFAKLEYFHFLDTLPKKITKTEEYTKKFNIGFILCIVLLDSNKLKKSPNNKNGYIGNFSFTDQKFKDSFKRTIMWFNKHIKGMTRKETVNFIQYIPHVKKVLERCWLQEKIKISIKHRSECSISIILGNKK